MPYTKQEVFNVVKEILLDLDIFKHIDEKSIVPSASLKYNLGFDEYDLQELFLQIEYRKNVNIKNHKAFNILMTLDEFCNALCKDLNTAQKQPVTIPVQRLTLFNRVKRFLVK
ncbi:MAG: hypothetical protein IJQ55_02370 [Alphaproteobacteria bacterium]|nr:hypothetical protein [Alphaproteobacteria bacterium]